MSHPVKPLPSARRLLRTPEDLIAAGLVPPEQKDALEAVAQDYATAIPPAFLDLIEQPDDPIGVQVIPSPEELLITPEERSDPIGDEALSPVPGIVHRYADRALLKPLLVCPLYCRFCFRREHVGPDGGVLDDAALEKALDWLRSHPRHSGSHPDGRGPADAVPSSAGADYYGSLCHAACHHHSSAYPCAGGST
ncbi:Lysine 2,3-aminomutase [Acetobacter malorum]|uniref:Lysine 2,3-aminomutase n=1 Tax=Acetobacter malorum TaxID=178901 RepID=A0A177GBT6_9PROT|nr:Lysine 2,3-aminomutase [Acetobacter malorum]